MRFDYVTDGWLDTASEEELRSTSRKLEAAMEEHDYWSDEYGRLSNIHVDVVNAICSRFPVKLPHREHGWYLPNDD